MASKYTPVARPTDVYWPTTTGKDLAAQVLSQWERYQLQCEETGRWGLWRRAIQRYFGYDSNGTRSDLVTFAGERGQVVKVTANHYRSLLKHILVMSTAQRPALRARATNADARSLSDTKLAEGLLDYYLTEEGVETRLVRSVEIGLNVAECDVCVTWDPHAGQTIAAEFVDSAATDLPPELAGAAPEMAAPPTARPVKEGDVRVSVHGPWDVARDLSKAPDECTWKIVRDTINKWDLAERYPDYRTEILQGSIGPLTEERSLYKWTTTSEQPDDIEIYTLYVAPSDAVPLGKTAIVAAGCTLVEGPIPYDEVPSYTLCPALEIASGCGYADAWDLLSLQQVHDSVLSTIVTNHDGFGIHNIAIPDGSTITPSDVAAASGMRIWRYAAAAGKPEVIDLLRIGEESFKLEETTRRSMETISGVNSVARGDLPEHVKSGAYAALVQSMALQFNSGVERAVAKQLERVGTAIVRCLQRNATTTRVADIVGQANRSYVKEWTGKDLSNVRRVTVEVGSAYERSTAGKADIADKWLERGLIQRPEQYVEVMRTGTLDPVTDAPLALQILIRSENEALSRGEPAPSLVTDNHDLHIEEHLAVLNSPDVRRDQRIAGAVLDHIKEHIMLKAEAMSDPMIAAIAGVPPSPPPEGGPAPEGDEPKGNGPVEVPGAPPPEGAELPSLPTNPLTGEEATA